MEDEKELHAELLAERLRHALNLARADLDALRAQAAHQERLDGLRLERLEAQAADFEERIRAATDGVTQFKLWSGLAGGGSGLVALAAFLKAFFGS